MYQRPGTAALFYLGCVTVPRLRYNKRRYYAAGELRSVPPLLVNAAG